VIGPLERSVRDLAAQLAYPADDPRAEMLDVACELARALDEGVAGNELFAHRVLTEVIDLVCQRPNQPPLSLDLLCLKRGRRRALATMQHASTT
jgi:hypothetical protein